MSHQPGTSGSFRADGVVVGMYAVERRRWIVTTARDAGRVEVAEVARTLEVAPETIRRDLNALERQGLLRRVHGGAVPVERFGFEGRFAPRGTGRHDEKARIAAAALPLLDGADTIYLDAGSTVQALAERFRPAKPVTVVTNALPVAMLLAGRPGVSLLLVGGRVRGHSLGTVDHWATRMLDELVIDAAVVGANGATVERGLTCPDAGVAAVKAAAVAVSRRRVLVADGGKFGVDSSYRFAHMRDMAAVVTDRLAGERHLRALRAMGVNVVVT